MIDKYGDFVMNDISLKGFQIVRNQYFTKQTLPQITLTPTAVCFNSAAFSALNNCENVQILLNEERHTILVRPISSSEGNAISWRKGITAPKYSKLECALFARQLFVAWGLKDKFRYRTTGKMVQSDNKVMLLFDFTHSEAWNGKRKVNDE